MKHAIALASVAAPALLTGCGTYYDGGYYRARVNSVPGPYVASDGYTQAWLDSCRYRSFDPVSGTYVGFDGGRASLHPLSLCRSHDRMKPPASHAGCFVLERRFSR